MKSPAEKPKDIIEYVFRYTGWTPRARGGSTIAALGIGKS